MVITDRFTGTAVLLTGAGSGIGRATAVRLVAEGAHVFAVDADEAGLAGTVDAVSGAGHIVAHVADVSDEAAVVAAVDAAVADLGALDVLVNVAGIHRTTPIERLTVDDLRTLFDVNVVGTALFCREALRHLPEDGVIVNTASSSASHGNPFMTAYSATKGAVLAFSLSLASEVIGRGVRVLVVSPGSTATPLTAAVRFEGLDPAYYARIVSPMGTGKPEQIASTIAFAASRDASYLTGVDLRVDGGSHI
ncbi:SDR family oxidoreductase [Geodermatophilus sp. DF01-2]|uniref:SDR family NAD(P)-dependent oxidoreductase n=1 Tax=Geodermatophilus sp. DF01-2 TaxID=2559610 RepID=UPI0010731489|nr:SDR family oxidoreductase [Geodermatophilus sp. DF01_2]TFV64296.1 SDR family oxidoreductase [Geodermatophilus sp. DF01_2]